MGNYDIAQEIERKEWHMIIGIILFIFGFVLLMVVTLTGIFKDSPIIYPIIFLTLGGMGLAMVSYFQINEIKEEIQKKSIRIIPGTEYYNIPLYPQGIQNKLKDDTLHIGDSDGFGIFYNEFGELILKSNEKIISREIHPNGLSIIDRWSDSGHVLFDSGEGFLYKTNQRIVFIGRPLTYKEVALFERGGGGIFDKITIYSKEKFLQEHNLFHYVDIPYHEIAGYKSGILQSPIICIFSKGYEYAIRFSPKNSEILRSLMVREI